MYCYFCYAAFRYRLAHSCLLVCVPYLKDTVSEKTRCVSSETVSSEWVVVFRCGTPGVSRINFLLDKISSISTFSRVSFFNWKFSQMEPCRLISYHLTATNECYYTYWWLRPIHWAIAKLVIPEPNISVMEDDIYAPERHMGRNQGCCSILNDLKYQNYLVLLMIALRRKLQDMEHILLPRKI